MPLYEWRCPKCHAHTTTTDNSTPPTCTLCTISLHRRYTFYKPAPFTPHFNVSLGRHVSSRQDFLEGLKAASDSATERTGIPHNYVPIDIADRDAFGATDESMDDYHRQHHDSPTYDQLREVHASETGGI